MQTEKTTGRALDVRVEEQPGKPEDLVSLQKTQQSGCPGAG